MRSITSYFGGGGPSTTEGFGAQHVLLSTVTTTSGHSNESAPKAVKAAKSTTQAASAAAPTVIAKDNTQESKKYIEQLRTAKEQAEYKVQRFEGENKVLGEKLKISEDRSTKLTKCLEELNRRTAFQDFRRRRDLLAADCVRLGKITTVRTGPTTMGDVWEEGYAIRDLAKRSAELLLRKEELETRKRKTQNAKRAAKKGAAAAQQQAAADDHMEVDGDNDLDLATETEVIKTHLEQLKRDESALAEERRLLESEKAVHQKELKRCQCEERSRFYRDLPALNDRYLLTRMLGRGGFSEVWKALDLIELREVAVKVHQLNPTWSEERKQSYIKHVTREYTIHRDMRHPRVVQLFDVFEIDVNSFATVLEYCRGIDLDEKLKRQKVLPEKDARAVLMQILSGLRYLHHPYSYGNANAANASGGGEGIGSPQANGGIMDNDHHHNSNNGTGGGMMAAAAMAAHYNHNKRFSIIHFDLKPANILFDEMGDVKITDFGLSKVIDESHEGTSMELTSQGAGTYWYLPPECFAKGPNPPRISSKVDVWSAGIIFFQMLYGTRPFGEGKTQENVWTENIIFNAAQVEFPNDPKAPKVSDEAKELIRVCLTRDQRLRPDVIAVCQHAYLKGK